MKDERKLRDRLSSATEDSLRVSAVLPTFQRVGPLRHTLRALLACHPPPAEIIVHVDGGDCTTADTLRREFSTVRVLESPERVGPGGGRNRLLAAARYAFVASFDDDSYPLDMDFFSEVERLFEASPRAAVLAAAIVHEGEPVMCRSNSMIQVADFINCGCVYRKDVFAKMSGFVPIPLAYGMEESDLALRLHDDGWSIVNPHSLRVFHATKLAHHRSAAITKASLANLALLAFLRYPPRCWWIGAMQLANRFVWLVRHGRVRGLAAGILSIPLHLYRHRRYRSTVSAQTVRFYRALRLRPMPIETERPGAVLNSVLS